VPEHRPAGDVGVLALVGPTGSGKSSVALEVAEALDAEIVAVDAFTVYRGMDIGTAKPPVKDRRRVRHHMLDMLDPTEDCAVPWFQQAARAAIDGVVARGRRALLVGGSGLYFRAVVDPLAFPPTDAAVRAAIEAEYADDPAAAHAALAEVDPAAADRVAPGNLRRAVRALEVVALTGRPFSDWQRTWDAYEPVYAGIRVAGLDIPRADLVTRLDRRVDAMLTAGLLEECRRLARLPLSATARQAIGYAELFEHLAGRATLADAAERAKIRTRRYASRQARWFAADPRVRWLRPPIAASRILEVLAD
jgi:tRNA dimethylallyltransferase